MLLFVRHGEAHVNAQNRVPGHSLASPLTSTGHIQAQKAGRLIRKKYPTPGAVYCSDAERAKQTAWTICASSGCGIHVSQLLREQDMGRLEGRPTDQLQALETPAGSHIADIAWGGAESIADVYARMQHFLTLLRYEPATTIVLVGHADSLRVLEAVIRGVGHRHIDWDEPGLSHGEVRMVEWRR